MQVVIIVWGIRCTASVFLPESSVYRDNVSEIVLEGSLAVDCNHRNMSFRRHLHLMPTCCWMCRRLWVLHDVSKCALPKPQVYNCQF
jgi:hypothetical protein